MSVCLYVALIIFTICFFQIMAALSKEEDRFTRVNMLIGVATQALRIKFNQWQPPGALPVTLHKIKTKIIPSITRIQENILYPKLGKLHIISSLWDIK